MLVDSHCHLDLIDPELGSTGDLLEAARERGVEAFLCVAIGRGNIATVSGLAKANEGVFASAGVHPNTPELDEPSEQELITWAAPDEVIAVGETGLDYYRSEGAPEERANQRERLRRHVRAAIAVGKPLIIHMRDAAEDTLRILAEEHADKVGGVMHCFVEDWKAASRAMELGFYISFSGIVTFRSADALRDVALRIPDDRLLVETDAPYLAPVPHRGKTNQPAYVSDVAIFLAEHRGVNLEALARVTRRNFLALFSTARL